MAYYATGLDAEHFRRLGLTLCVLHVGIYFYFFQASGVMNIESPAEAR